MSWVKYENESSKLIENVIRHQGNTNKAATDPLCIYGGSITRARVKKMRVALNGLIETMWTENTIQGAKHDELGLEKRQGIVSIIQATR